MEGLKMRGRQGNSVGTSLRGCIRDIVDRNHPIERVERIVSSTEFTTRDELIAYVTSGKTTQKERMAEVAGRLWDNGKIFQPKIDGGEMPTFTGTKLWIPVASTVPAQPRPQLF